jgi:two-component system response regulator DesR
MMSVDAHPEAPLAPIRVVLGTMPPLLGDIVRETLAAHGDVEVLADVDTRDEIRPAVRRTDADVAVLGISSRDRTGLNGLLRELLADHPRLTVIALASDGRNGYVYQLQPSSVAIADVSPQSLVETIRATSAMDVHPRIHPFSAD